MARGISINIGLNRVDPDHYGGPMLLEGCEFDARDMADIARAVGFEPPTLLLSPQATTTAVTQAIGSAARQLQAGDILLLTYSGHGSQVTDKNLDENDGKDETWCLFDRQLVDDELFGLWSEFQAGVRILVFSDSCHSGTVAQFRRGIALLSENRRAKEEYGERENPELRIKALSKEVADKIFRKHRKEYEQIQRDFPLGNRATVNASVLLISACQDWELSLDGARNSVFTAALRSVWDNGNFQGNYIKFHEEIYRRTKDQAQQPNYLKVGVPSAAFEMQKPFTI
jgi:hypothetical protein